MSTGNGSGAPVSRTYFGWQEEKVAFIFRVSGQRAAMLAAGVLSAAWPLAVSDISTGMVCWPVAGLLVTLAFIR
ncbi:hypothetical protein ACWEN6_01185 [Sphaerisporangium sp. NPDC004334]